MSEINYLIIYRGQLKSQLIRFVSYVKDSKDSTEIEQLTHRREKIKVIWDAFEQVQTQIEVEKGVSENSEMYRIEFEGLYFKSMADCDKIHNMMMRDG